jgi:large conductance mechanosensitive channel
MLKDFRAFVLRGNVVDLAVAVVMGAAFGAVVTALVKDLITPLIAALVGAHHFDGLSFTVNHSTFAYGDFLNSVVSFVLIALVVFFLIVQPLNTLIAHTRRGPAPEPDTKKCPECLSVIPIGARRCAYCTSEQPAT